MYVKGLNTVAKRRFEPSTAAHTLQKFKMCSSSQQVRYVTLLQLH